jgi:hypothetical protein
MRVLVACEYSGAVRDAFRALGHDATSCDLRRASRGGRMSTIKAIANLLRAPATNTDDEKNAALIAALRATTEADALAKFRSQLGLDGEAS